MYVPAGHNEQVASDADVAPVCPYVPAEQGVPKQGKASVHSGWTLAETPTPSEYLPAGQLLQAEAPLVEKNPVGQTTHTTPLVAPTAAENLPALHRAQADAPVPELKRPFTQLWPWLALPSFHGIIRTRRPSRVSALKPQPTPQ